jgi:glycosyltransferase involved in cell wall biosynthesis
VRILQLHNRHREEGGEDAVVRVETALLRQRGHEVVQHQVCNPPGVGVAVALGLAPWNPLEARAVRGVVASTRPDVAHVHNTWYAMSPAVLWTLRRARVPVVVTLHNFRLACANALLFRDGQPCEDCIGSHPWHGVRHGCYFGSVPLSVPAAGTIALHRGLGTWRRCVELFLVLNEFARARFLRDGLPEGRMRIKSNFVAEPGPRSVSVSDSRTVLYAGRLSPEKGVDVLLEAWRLAASSSLELVVVGDGPIRGQLERRSVPGIRFEGRLSPAELRQRMLAARALVLPSVWYEGQPVVVLEALAAGLPVLASRTGGMEDLLRPVAQEWLVTPGAVAPWTAAVRSLEDDEWVEAGSRRARAHYERSFTELSAAHALEDAYDWARSHPVRLRP